MKVAFLIDDGIVLSGVYNRRRFVPDNKGCGFHYQVIAESDIGKILFFNEDLANMCVEEPHNEKRQYLIKLKTDEFHDDYSKVISARSRKDAIDKIADYLYQKNRVGVWNIYHILENYDTDNIEDFWKREKIIQCGSHGQYVRLIKAVEFVK